MLTEKVATPHDGDDHSRTRILRTRPNPRVAGASEIAFTPTASAIIDEDVALSPRRTNLISWAHRLPDRSMVGGIRL